ncbi:serine hydrolase [Mesorhizobium sp. CGMCC 1.15528]|uniref:beta-lactamase n=1 Tax=Mesorhizobium zhangyense TaxID=1776730 RepID=A0A7C9VBN0_9HYPH|nr:serine hydrolase [Mesorhizobium zhangyense]NGN44823.1 serine hydrolase [Mesorhizobium zhangyense]
MNASQLNARLQALSENRGFDIYWHVRLAASGEELTRGGDIIMPSASVRKISVMMAALNAAAEGRLDLDQTVVIRKEQQPGILSGVCQYMTPGLTFPMRDAILQMIITSDNICTYEVMKDLEIPEFTAYCHRIGMENTTHRTRLPPVGLSPAHALEHVTTTTACDQVLLLQLILAGANGDAAATERLGVDAANCAMALRFLTWQRFRSMIPGHLPTMTTVANKTGWGERGWMDAAIVFKDDAPLYIMSVTTDQVPKVMPNGLPGRVASTVAIAELSRACWDALG